MGRTHAVSRMLETETMNADKGSRKAPADAASRSAMIKAQAVKPEAVKAQASGSVVTQAFIAGEALIIFGAVALMSTYGRHRGDSRRGATHARTPGRPDAGDPWMGQPDPPRPETEPPPVHVDDYPSWPGRPGPYALHPDHPSWPGSPDPRWADTEAALRADDYPSWPDGQAPPRPVRPVPPRQERPVPPRPERRVPPRPDGRGAPLPDAGPPGPGNDAPAWSPGGSSAPRQQPPPPPPPPARSPRFQAAPTAPAPSAPALPARARTDLAPRAYPTPTQPILRGSVAEVIDQSRSPARPARPQPAHAQTWAQPAPTQTWQQPAPARPEAGPVWDAGSVQLATWIISEANQHAADIRHEARDEAATSLAGAKQEATQLVRQASDQAAATLAAAELEAEEIRANVTKLTAELGGIAAHVTQSLYAPAGYAPAGPALRPAISPELVPEIAPVPRPAPEPEAAPAAPAPKPAVNPAADTAAPPATKPAAIPAPKPAARPGTATTRGTRSAAKPKARQLVAIRVMTILTATLVVFALITGTAEVALHGFAFFVFRATGTGETGPNGLQENQGPGQPDAPKLSPIHLHTAP
jgi:hypothetical protein